jgi:Ca2+-binding RTX toxin-like protein
MDEDTIGQEPDPVIDDGSIDLSLDNELIGDENSNTIAAGPGNDTVEGLGGNDTIDGESGNDEIWGGAGNDDLSGGLDNDLIFGELGNDSITGEEGDDSLWGSEGNDSLEGGFGNDRLEGEEGDDSLLGGIGADTLIGGLGLDQLWGGQGDDSLDGGSDNDRLEGEDGNDVLKGGNADDYLNGGTGNDSIDGGNGADYLVGESGNDQIMAGEGNDFVEGGSGNDSIVGDAGDDTLLAGMGDDTLEGNEGDDSLVGDDGNDYIDGGSGHDYLDGGRGLNTLTGGSGNDSMIGGIDSDLSFGGEGDDRLEGDDGADDLSGENGNDIIFAGNGNDYVKGGSGNDSLEGESGDDFADGGDGDDTIFGGLGNDLLTGGAGNDSIRGGDGNDTITGGPGNDFIEGGLGFDIAVFPGLKGDYRVEILDQEVIVTSPTEGRDILKNMEILQFGDGAVQQVGEQPWIRAVTWTDDVPGKNASRTLNVQFSEPVKAISGELVLTNATGQIVQRFSMSQAQSNNPDNGVLQFPLSKDLDIYQDYRVSISDKAVEDLFDFPNYAMSDFQFRTAAIDGLYHFFVVAFAAAPGSVYMGQLAEAYNYFQSIGSQNSLNNIVEIFTTKTQFTSIYPQALVREDKGSYFSYAHDLSVESKPLVRGAEVTRDVYNQQMAELSKELVERIVKQSASTENKTQAVADIQDALALGGEWTIGKVIYTIFGNLANKPLDDPDWGNTALQFNNQTVVARYLTEVMQYPSEDVEVLRSSIAQVSHLSNVSNDDNVISLIGSLPPGG